MQILSHCKCLLVALTLLVAGFAIPLPAQDKTIPQSPDGAAAVPKAPAVKEAAPAGAGSASLRISGVAFRPRTSDTGFAFAAYGSMYATSDPGGVWTAPVYLPQGAVITSVRMYYYDQDTTNNCTGILSCYDCSTETSALPTVQWNSAGNGGWGHADSPNINYTVDNSLYAFVLGWVPRFTGTNMRLVGFQIFYTPPPGQNKVAVIPLN